MLHYNCIAWTVSRLKLIEKRGLSVGMSAQISSVTHTMNLVGGTKFDHVTVLLSRSFHLSFEPALISRRERDLQLCDFCD